MFLYGFIPTVLHYHGCYGDVNHSPLLFSKSLRHYEIYDHMNEYRQNL